ncbi:MAG: ankyrin repeat domain-containing protein [Novosphingobium sp.]|nr:ankyrin repeat domain-containing protein [Novosphingobium sp.]
MPAQAQFSQGYKFLDAVRKKEGQKVEDALNEPGSTIINAKDVSSGETALHIVTQRRDVTWMSYLIGKGANVNARDNSGVTPLQVATNLGFLEGVALLVSRKADLNQSNDAGETPLITAVHRKDLGMLRILLKAGADPDRADNSGRSARDYAKLAGNSSMLSTIESEAKVESKAGKNVYGPTL